MSFDFALKDFYRKKNQTYPYVITIALVVALSIFLIYVTTSLGLNLASNIEFLDTKTDNEYFYSGAINIVYSQFSTLILVLVLILTFIVVIVITTTLVVHKKKDIAIMRALGTLPRNLYGFYLLEAYIIFFLGFAIGYVIGLISFGVFMLVMFYFGYILKFQLDYFYTFILFFSCFVGIFVIPGYTLRRIGNQKLMRTFSKDIPYDFDSTKKLPLIPRKISNFSFNFKIAVVNTYRRKGEFRRYLIIFSILFLIIFTLALGSIVLSNSSKKWIDKSQGDNIIIIGHEDVVDKYADMYKMFSDPELKIDEDDIDFLASEYVFNFSDINKIKNFDEIEEIDERFIKFCDVEEINGIYYGSLGNEQQGYMEVGQQRKDNIPIVGVDPDHLIQDFEIEGDFFNDDDSYDNMTIGDGLAYNFFDYPMDQSMLIKEDFNYKFHISGVVIDSFYSGYAGYIGLNEFREQLNYSNDEVNIVVIEVKNGKYDSIKDELEELIKSKLNEDFTIKNMDDVFEGNLQYLDGLNLYPILLIILLGFITILSLYNYQKSGIMEKAKDFLIMRALGTKNKSIKKILFIEAIFCVIPALMISLSFGMLINSLVLLDRVYLPPLYVPLMIMGILFSTLIIFNLLSLIPIMKKINNFNIKDFDIY